MATDQKYLQLKARLKLEGRMFAVRRTDALINIATSKVFLIVIFVLSLYRLNLKF